MQDEDFEESSSGSVTSEESGNSSPKRPKRKKTRRMNIKKELIRSMRHNSARQMIDRIETFDKVPTLITSRNRGAHQHSTYSSAKNVKEDTQEATFSSKIRSRSNISPVSVNIECKHLDFSRRESFNAPLQSKFKKAM